MTRRHRKSRKKNKQKKIIIITIIAISLLLTVSYASFQTNINITTTGKTKIMYSHMTIKKLSKTNNTTIFTDPFGNIRYTGPNEEVNNYVCLKDETPCQDKHLFRIIGSFLNIDDGNGKQETRVKVIKATSYGDFKYNSYGNNNWAEPSSINDELNNAYFSSLDQNAQNIIGNAVWNLGGFCCGSEAAQIKVDTAYNIERKTSHYGDNPIINTAKIGLMYPSDYGYASRECYSNKNLKDYADSDCTNSNYLFGNQNNGTMKNEWLISHYSGSSTYATCVREGGQFNQAYAIGSIMTIRPTFFLKSNTILITKNHDGTKINPYIVKLYEEN